MLGGHQLKSDVAIEKVENVLNGEPIAHINHLISSELFNSSRLKAFIKQRNP